MNEAAFLSALHESPNDEVTWLALADWLDEDGQADRAELVRLVRQLRTLPLMKRKKPRSTLEDRVAALLGGGTRPVVPEYVNAVSLLAALLFERRFNVPPVVVAVAPIVIMIPGIFAFETIVFFNHGQMLDALRALAACSFIVGALAMGLAAARFTSPR